MAKRIAVTSGDLFLVPRRDGQWVLGQVIEEWMKGGICIAVFDYVVSNLSIPVAVDSNAPPPVISLPSVAKVEISRGYWPVVGHVDVMVDVRLAPHHEFAGKNYDGAVWYSGKLIEELVDAYYGLVPWDLYPEVPNRLRKLLL